MKRFFVTLFAVTLGSGVMFSAPASAAGVDELARFVGTWQSPGTLMETPYSKAGSATATTSCAWSDDRMFVI